MVKLSIYNKCNFFELEYLDTYMFQRESTFLKEGGYVGIQIPLAFDSFV